MSTVGGYKGAKSQKNAGYTQRKNFYVELGSNVYRVLPPFASLAEQGKLAAYHAVTWLPGSDGKKRPVVSIFRKDRQGNVIVHDPLIEKIENLKKVLEKMKAEGGDAKRIEEMSERLWSLQTDKAYYVNAMNPAGEIGVLKLKATSYNALLERLDELESKENIDAISPGEQNGVFFNFKRVKDSNGKTIYTTDVHTVSKTGENGRPVKEYAWAPIDESVLKRMEKEASDLTKLFTPRTPEEITLLATLDPKMVDRIFQRPEETAAEVDTEEADGLSAEVELAATVNTVKNNVAKTVAQTVAPTTATSTPAPSSKVQSSQVDDIESLIFGSRR